MGGRRENKRKKGGEIAEKGLQKAGYYFTACFIYFVRFITPYYYFFLFSFLLIFSWHVYVISPKLNNLTIYKFQVTLFINDCFRFFLRQQKIKNRKPFSEKISPYLVLSPNQT